MLQQEAFLHTHKSELIVLNIIYYSKLFIE